MPIDARDVLRRSAICHFCFSFSSEELGVASFGRGANPYHHGRMLYQVVMNACLYTSTGTQPHIRCVDVDEIMQPDEYTTCSK